MLRVRRIASVAAVCFLTAALNVTFETSAFAQNQLPLDFRGLTTLETGPNWLAGPEDDLAAQFSHRGHEAADVHPASSASSAAAATTGESVSAPSPRPQHVVAADEDFFGFAGLTHFDQRFAGTGLYANTQFSLEPPDQGLCVGHGFVMEIINNALAVYDSSGKLLSGPTANSQFFKVQPEVIRKTPAVFGQFISDPRCYFDPETRRWFVTELEIDTNPATGRFATHSSALIAVSKTSNPIGDYFLYSFDTTDGTGTAPGHPRCPCFGDQPLIGADRNGFYVTSNEFPITGPGFNGAQLYAMSKSGLVSGTQPPVVHINVGAIPVPPQDQPNGGIWYSVQPATSPGKDWDDEDDEHAGTEYFLSALQFGPSPYDNRVAVWALTNTRSLRGSDPDVELLHTVVQTESYGMAPGTFSAPQKSGSTPLRDALGDVDPLEQLAGNDDRMNQVVFAAGDLWAGVNTSIVSDDGTTLGIAWFAITPSLHFRDLDARVDNQGYVSVDGENVIFPSIGVNRWGQADIAFTLVGPDHYPTAAYAPIIGDRARRIRVAAAGVGPDDGFTGYASEVGPPGLVGRWGDYSAAAADEDGNIWFAAEYIGQTCTLAQFAADTTCGGTRSLLANWGTFVGRVSPF